jgi:NAD(P)-dependent dehydrogenase (short-subunit alcohol dehydrogenase family)
VIAAGQHLLVFGGSGAIGGAVVQMAASRGWQVTAVARQGIKNAPAGVRALTLDPLSSSFTVAQLEAGGTPYTSVCWAQGANTNDSVYNVDMDEHRALYEANCSYILVTLKALLESGLLASGSRLCVISSIWQDLARQTKLSYCMTKAALQGLVLSASADLARDGHLMNAVLPGAIETPMTRKNLSAEQIERLTMATGHHRLVTLEEVAAAVCFLCSPENTGITGQFLAADLGFSHVRIV